MSSTSSLFASKILKGTIVGSILGAAIGPLFVFVIEETGGSIGGRVKGRSLMLPLMIELFGGMSYIGAVMLSMLSGAITGAMFGRVKVEESVGALVCFVYLILFAILRLVFVGL